MLKSVIYVGLGSAIGGIFRFLLYRFITSNFSKISPTETFVVNVLGCFVMGVAFVFCSKKSDVSLFLMTGILGGFTTFSAFSLEIWQLIEQKQEYKAMFYAFSSVFCGVLFCFVGYWVASLLSKT